MLKVLFVLACTSCVHADRAMLAVSTATIACDWGQTRQAAKSGWGVYYEKNPYLGEEPGVLRVDSYFVTMLAANALIWVVVPEKWRTVYGITITGIQGRALYRSMEYGERSACGI